MFIKRENSFFYSIKEMKKICLTFVDDFGFLFWFSGGLGYALLFLFDIKIENGKNRFLMLG